jgi:hypothetical protein
MIDRRHRIPLLLLLLLLFRVAYFRARSQKKDGGLLPN